MPRTADQLFEDFGLRAIVVGLRDQPLAEHAFQLREEGRRVARHRSGSTWGQRGFLSNKGLNALRVLARNKNGAWKQTPFFTER